MTISNIEQDRNTKMSNIYSRGDSVIKVLEYHINNSISDVWWAMHVYEHRWLESSDEDFAIWVGKNMANTFYSKKLIITSNSGMVYTYIDKKLSKQKVNKPKIQEGISVGDNLFLTQSQDTSELVFSYFIKNKGSITVHVSQDYFVDIFTNLRHHWEILVLDINDNVYSKLVNEFNPGVVSILSEYNCNKQLLIKADDVYSQLGNCHKSKSYDLYFVVLYDYSHEMSGHYVRKMKNISALSLFLVITLIICVVFLVAIDKLILSYYELRQLKDTFEELSCVDELTAISNRRSIMKRLVQEMMRFMRYKTPLSVMSFDIDFFKKINDTYGHGVGDIVLKNLVIEVQRCLRQSDILGRIGGEEFLVLMCNTDLVGAGKLAERIRAKIEMTEIAKGIFITISIGVCGLKTGETSTQLLEKVDVELYKAKNNGRNQVSITTE